jgi:hypothetical protein
METRYIIKDMGLGGSKDLNQWKWVSENGNSWNCAAQIKTINDIKAWALI